MLFLIDSIQAAVKSDNLFSGVLTALTVPDVAVSAAHVDGHTNGPRYVAWVDRWLHQQQPDYRELLSLDGNTFYSIRCTLLQQGLATPARSEARPRGNRAAVKRQLCFTIGTPRQREFDLGGIRTTCVDAREFCLAMATAARAWTQQVDAGTQARLRSLAEIRNEAGEIDQTKLVLCVDY